MPGQTGSMPEDPSQDPRIVVATGARATERLLLATVEPLVEAGRADWRLLARPVRIVVPSRSLRGHVCAAVVRHFGAAVAGVEVQTLGALAREVLGRAGEPATPGDALVPLLVRGAARGEPLLVRELGALHDGFGAIVGSVRDLLDAGRVRESADAIEDALASLGRPAAVRERAGALVRVACAVSEMLDGLGLDSRASVLARACDALRRDPEGTLPRRAVVVHGFADATGVATDLIEALLRERQAVVLLDRPPDPAEPGEPDPGCAFSERFAGRLAAAAQRIETSSQTLPPPEITLVQASGTAAEVRGVAQRVRVLLDANAAPESIGVVARSLGPVALQIREHFGQLGIPFSALAARGGPDGAGRRIDAVLTLLERGGGTSVDRWLAALAPRSCGDALPADLRLALHSLGAARLEQVAALDVEGRLGGKAGYALPVRHGISLEEDDDGELRPHARRRLVSAEALRSLAGRAKTACEIFSGWPTDAPLGDHLARTGALLVQGLGLGADDRHGSLLVCELDRLASDLPASQPAERAGFCLLLRDAFAPLRSRALGGEGAGVQVLDATEARARTFEHLFVLGLGRDVFPRLVSEDPLLPDSLRRGLQESGAGVLPDLPLKLGGLDEERYLFAQLLSASPRVTLSWQSVDDDGKERAASTLLERLRLAGRTPPAERQPALWAQGVLPGPRPAAEHLVLAGLHASRAAVARIMPLAVAEVAAGGAAAAELDAGAVARGRIAALDLLEPRGGVRDDTARDRIGPTLGFVGERRDGGLREASLAVTTLERMARCPWQAFLDRVLHVEPAPDALEALPAVDALLLGSVLHKSVEEIVKEGIGEGERSLAAAIERGARPVRWPSDAEVRHILRREAERLLAGEGILAPGLAGVVAATAEPMAREVFERVWRPAAGEPALLGAELEGSLCVDDAGGGRREIRFRADLVEETSDGLRLIDLKTGKSIVDAKTAKTERKHLLAAVATGKGLQAAAYAFATGGKGDYLYTDPLRAKGQTLVTIGSGDAELAGVFDETVQTLLDAWDRGSFLPRLVLPARIDEDKKGPCLNCEVSEACAYGDTGARQRLRRWAAASDGEDGPAATALVAARAVFELPARRGAPGSPGEAEEAA